MAALIVDAAIAGPATHAFVVGCGTYAHLEDGSGAPAHNQWGLGQLTSAAVSARYFIDWLLHGFHNDRAPLASIEHLVSEGTVEDLGGANHDSEMPTMVAVERAYRRWLDRVGSHPDNIAIVYFCGHGLFNNGGTALLCADFADPAFATTSRNAIHLEATVRGMLACAARRQCFFIDSCRTTDTQWQAMMDQPGQPLGAATVNDLAAKDQPVFFATGRTQTAVAVAGEVSLFTHALIEALNGLAADDPFGDYALGSWVVDTANIARAVNMSIDIECYARPFLAGPRCNFGGDGAHFELHYPQPPLRVPVIVGCDPASFNQQATFAISRDGTLVDRRAPNPALWISRQEPDQYEVAIDLNGSSTSRILNLYPPGKRALFPIPPTQANHPEVEP